MKSDFLQYIEKARAGIHPGFICQVPSGWVVLSDMQYLRGYCILLADPPVRDINVLQAQQRTQFLVDMAHVGDALLEVTGAYRINYAIMGNSDPYLHAHIVPRYIDEPEKHRKDQPWSYPEDVKSSRPLDPQCDRELMKKIAQAIQKYR